MTSPTQRTIDELAKRGYMAEVVERWIPKTKVRKDLFGFIDILAVNPHRFLSGCLGIQVTTSSNLAARFKKICGPCAEQALNWLTAGNRIEVWGWRKLKGKGWKPRIMPVLLVDVE